MGLNPSSLGIDTEKNIMAPPPVEGGQPVQTAPDALSTFNDLLSRYAEANPAAGLAGLQMTPESLAILGGGKGGGGSKLISGVGSAAKGFAEGWASTRPQGMDAKTQAEIEKLNAETAEIKGKGNAVPEKQNDLAGEYGKAYGQYTTDLKKYNQVKDNFENKNTYGIALLSLAKLALPEVRSDEEAANALASGTGILKQFQNTYDKWIKGEKIGDDEREAVLTAAKNMMRDRKSVYKESTRQIEKRATGSGIDIETIKLNPISLEITDPITMKMYEMVKANKGTPEELAEAKRMLIEEGVDIE